MIKLFAVTAFSVGMVTGAMAQAPDPATPTTPTAPPSASSTAMPSGWSGAISEAFFTDETGATLRTDDEITERWSSLAGEQQDQVRADCETISSSDMGTGSSGAVMGTDTGTAASTPSTDAGTSASTPSPDAGTSDAAPSGDAASTSNGAAGGADSSAGASSDGASSDGASADTSMSANAMPLDHVCNLIKDL